MTLQAASLIAPSSQVIIHRSPWHSPVPYLFGGFAAMLSLIAFALLILACSCSKHAGNRENDDEEHDLEAGDTKTDNNDKDLAYVFEEKYLEIMAGQANPTFFAAPVSNRVTSFCSCSCKSDSTEKSSNSEENEKEKEERNEQEKVRNTENHETAEQHN